MSIQFSLISLLSTLMLLLCFVSGDTITVDGIAIDVAISQSSATVQIHPTFLAWTDSAVFRKYALGATFGNVIILSSSAADERKDRGRNFDRVIAHERRHIEQFTALGELMLVAKYFVHIEPIHHDWDNPSVELAEMWTPPSWWPYKWSFMTITIDRRQG